jgi:hypothetical protein
VPHAKPNSRRESQERREAERIDSLDVALNSRLREHLGACSRQHLVFECRDLHKIFRFQEFFPILLT